MSAPLTPINLFAQQGNGKVYLSWEISTGSTSYDVLRSEDNVNFSVISSPTANNFLDEDVTVGTEYWYKVLASNGDGDSSPTNSQWAIPAVSGNLSLKEIRLMAQQRADRVNSNFVTLPEWNTYINQSYFELYDLVVNVYEDFYLAVPVELTTDGSTSYVIPDGTNFLDDDDMPAKPLKNLVGIDLALSNSSNAKVTINRFNFIDRNKYVYPNISGTFLGVFNLEYRLMGNKLHFIPPPSSGQVLTIWYIPRMTQLLADTDMADGINGWLEYVIVDAAIKALQKEESDVTMLMAQKQALKKRIEESAVNRDAGQPSTISKTRTPNGSWGPGYNGSFGGL